MPWKPLPDDVPLDHETLAPAGPSPVVADAPAPAADPGANPPPAAAAPQLTELPPDAQLDGEQPAAPPAIGTGTAPTKGIDATPTYHEQGFADTMQGDPVYHSTLSDAEQQEYSSFFKDPRHPPDPRALERWMHEKTGALMTNADEIVAAFKKTGQFNTAQHYNFPTKAQSAPAAGLAHFANGLVGDFGAEVAAPLDALGLGGGDRPNVFNSDESFGNLLTQNADLEHAQLDRDTADHPIASPVGELGGIVASAPVGGAAADLARVGKLGEIGADVAKATTGGMIVGAGSAGPGHRGEGAIIGGVMAPATAALLKVPVAGYRAVASVFETAPQAARRIIAKAIEDDANSGASVGQDIGAAHANDVPMALGDTGENARGTLAAASRASGVGRTVARDALEERQAGLADRVVGHIERDLGPIANPHELADTMMTKAHNDAAPLYEAAYSMPVADAVLTKIEPLLQRPSMKKAITNAQRIAQEEGADPSELGLVTDEAGNVVISRTPSWQTLDYIKRGMDDVVESYRDPTSGKLNLDTEGRAINNTLRSYLSVMDTANPAYAAARAAYGGQVKGVAAMNAGRKALSMTADDLEAKMRAMTPYEKEMFALGTRRAMAELVRSKGDSADVVNALVGTGKKRAMLGRLFGDRKGFQRFVDTLDQEKQGWRTFKQALLGSPTAANHADDAALEFATTGAEIMAHGGLPVTTAIRKAVQIIGRKPSEKVQQQIAALLSNTDPAALRELASQLQRASARRGLKIKVGRAVRAASGRAAVVLQAEQAQ